MKISKCLLGRLAFPTFDHFSEVTKKMGFFLVYPLKNGRITLLLLVTETYGKEECIKTL